MDHSKFNKEITETFDEYLILVNYNEPMNPYFIIVYYYNDGSCIRMVHGIESSSLDILELDFESGQIPVLNIENKICGHGIKIKTNSNLFIFV